MQAMFQTQSNSPTSSEDAAAAANDEVDAAQPENSEGADELGYNTMRLLLKPDGSLAVQVDLPADPDAVAPEDADAEASVDDDEAGSEESGSTDGYKLDLDAEIERARVEWAKQEEKIFAPVSTSSSSSSATAQAAQPSPVSPFASSSTTSSEAEIAEDVNLSSSASSSSPTPPSVSASSGRYNRTSRRPSSRPL
jgi:cell division septation protein DedD